MESEFGQARRTGRAVGATAPSTAETCVVGATHPVRCSDHWHSYSPKTLAESLGLLSFLHGHKDALPLFAQGLFLPRPCLPGNPGERKTFWGCRTARLRPTCTAARAPPRTAVNRRGVNFQESHRDQEQPVVLWGQATRSQARG